MKFSKNKFLWLLLSLISIALFIVASLSISYIINGPSNWIKWQTFIYPIVCWIAIIPFYWLYIKMSKPNKKISELATSNFMDQNTFNKKFNFYKENHNFKSSWIVKTKLNKKNELSFYQAKQEGHSLVIGSTGSGKTSLLLDANIQLFARSSDKPSMIISDPKKELFNTHSKFLFEKGYEIISINLRDYERSSHWNPLEPIWELWFSIKNQEFKKEEALNFLSELATTLFPYEKKYGGDNFFNQSAATVFQFFTIAYLERAQKNRDEWSKEFFNLSNIISNIHQTSFDELQDLIEELGTKSQAIMVGGANIKGSEKTVSGTLQTCVTTMKIYNDPIIKRVTSDTNIKLDITKPQAIFIIVPDESETKYPFISLFVSEMYKKLISLASKSFNNRSKRRIYFLLDEFGNIPKIPRMSSMITVSRSRNIFFMLLLQNYSQLNEKYGNHIANTIISNCGYEFFILTSDVETAKKFSQKLGQKSIITKSKSNSSNEKGSSSTLSESERTRQLLHLDELMKLNFGEFILSMQRENPIISSLAMLRKWKNFKRGQYKVRIHQIKDFASKHLKNFVKLDDEIEIENLDDFIEKHNTKNQENCFNDD